MSRNEEIILRFVHDGTLRIEPDGSIWRVKTRTRTGRVKRIEPCRADYLKSDGYRFVRVNVNGRGIAAASHRVIWATAYGPIPDGYEINHKDGNRGNNVLGNLEPLTPGDNQRHSYRVLGKPRFTGESCNHSKLTFAQVAEIRRRCAAGEAKRALARAYAVSPNAIRKIVYGRSWRDQFPQEPSGVTV